MITINTTPPKRHPAYNPALYTFESDSVEANFMFYIEIEDNVGNPITNPIKLPFKPNTNEAQLDVSRYVQTYVDNELISGGHQILSKGVFPYVVRFGEEYSFSYNYTGHSEYTGPSAWNGYTMITGAVAHPFVVGDQLNIMQSDAGLNFPQLSGLVTVVQVVSTTEFVVNVVWQSVLSVSGLIVYADGRKTVDKNLINVTKEAYNGAWDSNVFRREVDGTEFETFPRKFATNLKSGFRVMEGFDMWINALLFDSTCEYFAISNDVGEALQHTVASIGDSMQFYAGYDVLKYDIISGSGDLTADAATKISFEYGNSVATISEVITLDIYKGCTVDLIELLYCDRFGSYLPFYFRLVNEETKEAKRELLTNEEGEELVIGEDQRRSWSLRTDWLNSVELELFDILLTSPDVRIKLNDNWERVIVTTNSSQTARNKVRKRKEINVRLAMADNVNV